MCFQAGRVTVASSAAALVAQVGAVIVTGVLQSWLEEPDLMPDTPSSPAERQLALGNLINDPGTLGGENVRFEVLSVPRDMPAPLLSLLPSVTVSGSGGMVMAVTAKRDMHAGDEPVELLVSYGADPKSMGYPI